MSLEEAKLVRRSTIWYFHGLLGVRVCGVGGFFVLFISWLYWGVCFGVDPFSLSCGAWGVVPACFGFLIFR